MQAGRPIRRLGRGLGVAYALLIGWTQPASGALLEPHYEDGVILAARVQEPESSALPAVLSVEDARLYREIFAAQEKGDWATANKRIAKLTDRRLIGHVLAQKFLHPTAYRSKYKELRDWMAHYADHPDARRIYKLAIKRRPKNYRWPRRPAVHRTSLLVPWMPASEPYRSTKRLNRKGRRKAARLKRRIRYNVARTRLTITEQLLEGAQAKRYLDSVERDDAYASVAAAWYYYGQDERAYNLASAAARGSGEEVPIAHWTAGLAAWRLGRLEDAAGHFEELAQSEKASAWNVAAGAYWASRAHLKLRNPAEMSGWLALAAKHPRTFYGLLAQRALGLQPRFDFRAQGLDSRLVARLESDPASARALALLQVGERLRAERELKGVKGWADTEMTQALLGLAARAGMAELAFRLGSRISGPADAGSRPGALDTALFPVPSWRPKDGFIIDRALVYALIRQESGFNPRAKSPDGARGLMQLMPRTASFVARDRGFRRRKRNQLFDPATNLQLGQRYIAHLMKNGFVRDNLFRLATAYNGGPGNLRKWERRMDYADDPLLFLESLPSKETRLFVERVVTNLWMYRARLNQPTPSLDNLAAGDWPIYQALDPAAPELASNEAN